MKKLVTVLAVLAATAVVAGSAVAARFAAQANGSKKAVTSGFYRGQTIGYFDFGPIKLKSGNKIAPLWTVTNPAAGQHNIVDTVHVRAYPAVDRAQGSGAIVPVDAGWVTAG